MMGVDEGAVTRAATRVRAALASAAQHLIDRQHVVELIGLAAVAQEHVLIVGPPGTAKSETARRAAGAFGGQTFEYLLGRFTEPAELFGAVDLARLRDGVVEIDTAGMLPEAQFAFLDEVFRGSTAILNTLLSILQERLFRHGATSVDSPLRVCVGAANHLPSDVQLEAFADRFMVHVYVTPTSDALLEDLLSQGWQAGVAARPIRASLDDLDQLTAAARAMTLDAVRPELATAVRTLREAGISLSDRRIVRLQSLVAAAAALAGRTEATGADLWPIVHAVMGIEAQRDAHALLAPLLAASRNATLPHAAERASASAAARTERLLITGRALLASEVDVRLELEAVVREIDASTPSTGRDAELTALRAELVSTLQELWT